MENILTIELLQKYIDEERIDKNLLSYDTKPYLHFLKYFQDIAIIDEHHFYIAASFVYSWMPTMLKTVDCNEGVLDILNKIKAGHDVNEDDLVLLTACVNNSLVGVSKLLHFIAPDRYAIWDSRVYRSIFNREYDMYKKGLYKEYLAYTQCARKLIELPEYSLIHNYIVNELDEKVDVSKITKLRSLELVLYATEHKIKIVNEENNYARLS